VSTDTTVFTAGAGVVVTTGVVFVVLLVLGATYPKYPLPGPIGDLDGLGFGASATVPEGLVEPFLGAIYTNFCLCKYCIPGR
jgi:hypothetical protein